MSNSNSNDPSLFFTISSKDESLQDSFTLELCEYIEDMFSRYIATSFGSWIDFLLVAFGYVISVTFSARLVNILELAQTIGLRAWLMLILLGTLEAQLYTPFLTLQTVNGPKNHLMNVDEMHVEILVMKMMLLLTATVSILLIKYISLSVAFLYLINPHKTLTFNLFTYR